MKFKTHVDCSNCKISCDIYSITRAKNKDFIASLNPIQVDYKRHEIICKQGKEVTHAIYLVSGSAKLYIEGINNRNITLYILNPNSYIGLLSFFESVSYSYSVAALEDCRICMIEIPAVKQLYLENHDFLLRLNKAFSKSVASILKKFININQKNIRGRVADSLLYLSQFYESDTFTMKLSRKELGELSAISEENTVRLLTEFKNEGIISVDGKSITLCDKKILKQIADFG
jgi:CRP/FNR family transcriptional regulator, polysaccharide utilization system transcription regulator